MKTSIIGVVSVVAASFLVAQPTSAGPVTFVANKTAHFVHKTGQRIDEHLIQPSRRVIVNHMPRARTPHRSS